MTKKLDKPRIRGIAPADQMTPDWYLRVYLRWAIRRTHRFHSYWSTAARVLHLLRLPEQRGEAMRWEVAKVLLPDEEVDNPDPKGLGQRPSIMPARAEPSLELLADLERLTVAYGVAPIAPEHYSKFGRSRGLVLPASEDMEPLRAALVTRIEPFLRAQMRADPGR